MPDPLVLAEQAGEDIDFRIYSKKTPEIGEVYFCEIGHVTLELSTPQDFLALGKVLFKAMASGKEYSVKEVGEAAEFILESCQCGYAHLYVTEGYTVRFDFCKAELWYFVSCVVKAIEKLGLPLKAKVGLKPVEEEESL
jgi:hypothetical protein